MTRALPTNLRNLGRANRELRKQVIWLKKLNATHVRVEARILGVLDEMGKNSEIVNVLTPLGQESIKQIREILETLDGGILALMAERPESLQSVRGVKKSKVVPKKS